MKIIKSIGLEITNKNDQKLLTVAFTDGDGHDYSWAPQWNSVRELLLASVLTEFANQGGTPNEELRHFIKHSEILQTILHEITGIQHGQFCLEASDDWLKELHKIHNP